ncbi:MAG: UpxY family transcription antiterminator [Bryobacterales bacterium]|nr:UpxY family transcription antiterminator [Bryobacterales bacterium]
MFAPKESVMVDEELPEDVTGMGGVGWYAIQVKARCEKQVAQALQNKGYEIFLPLQKSRRRWSDRYQEISVPLFPSYVFGRFEADNRLPILTTPFVFSIVGAGRQIVPVDPEQIEAVRRLMASGLPIYHSPFLKVGQRVLIEHGLLRGQEGILTRVKNTWRVVVSVDLIRQSAAVEVDREHIRVING